MLLEICFGNGRELVHFSLWTAGNNCGSSHEKFAYHSEELDCGLYGCFSLSRGAFFWGLNTRPLSGDVFPLKKKNNPLFCKWTYTRILTSYALSTLSSADIYKWYGERITCNYFFFFSLSSVFWWNRISLFYALQIFGKLIGIFHLLFQSDCVLSVSSSGCSYSLLSLQIWNST